MPSGQVFAQVVEVARAQRLPAPNVDLPLGALVWSLGAEDDAGHVLFTVARMSGWIAHYLEELGESPLRFRARAVYAAPRNAPVPSSSPG